MVGFGAFPWQRSWTGPARPGMGPQIGTGPARPGVGGSIALFGGAEPGLPIGVPVPFGDGSWVIFSADGSITQHWPNGAIADIGPNGPVLRPGPKPPHVEYPPTNPTNIAIGEQDPLISDLIGNMEAFLEAAVKPTELPPPGYEWVSAHGTWILRPVPPSPQPSPPGPPTSKPGSGGVAPTTWGNCFDQAWEMYQNHQITFAQYQEYEQLVQTMCKEGCQHCPPLPKPRPRPRPGSRPGFVDIPLPKLCIKVNWGAFFKGAARFGLDLAAGAAAQALVEFQLNLIIAGLCERAKFDVLRALSQSLTAIAQLRMAIYDGIRGLDSVISQAQGLDLICLAALNDLKDKLLALLNRATAEAESIRKSMAAIAAIDCGKANVMQTRPTLPQEVAAAQGEVAAAVSLLNGLSDTFASLQNQVVKTVEYCVVCKRKPLIWTYSNLIVDVGSGPLAPKNGSVILYYQGNNVWGGYTEDIYGVHFRVGVHRKVDGAEGSVLVSDAPWGKLFGPVDMTGVSWSPDGRPIGSFPAQGGDQAHGTSYANVVSWTIGASGVSLG